MAPSYIDLSREEKFRKIKGQIGFDKKANGSP